MYYGYNLKYIGSKPEKKIVTSENMLLKVKKKYIEVTIYLFTKSHIKIKLKWDITRKLNRER